MTVTADDLRIVQGDGRIKVYRPLPPGDRADAIRAGIALYERGAAFEAHEAWEPAWMGTDDLAERALLQGLIKVAAAEVHAQRDNPAGIVRNLDGALSRLRYARDAGVATAPGIQVDLSALIADAEARRLGAQTGDTGSTIVIPWRPIP